MSPVQGNFAREQSGFRKGHFTADNLVGLTVGVAEAFALKKGFLAAFLDVDSASSSTAEICGSGDLCRDHPVRSL